MESMRPPTMLTLLALAKRWCVPLSFSPFWFSLMNLLAHSKENLRSNGDESYLLIHWMILRIIYICKIFLWEIYCLHDHVTGPRARNENILTFIMVWLHTGTNFPPVSVNSLLAVAMMKSRQRWNETGVPTQSHPQTAFLTLSAWNNSRIS
jgi:hypothetical protein